VLVLNRSRISLICTLFFLSLDNKSFWLVYIDLFFKIVFEKSGFHIHLIYEHVMNRCKYKKNFDKRDPSNRRISVKEVNTFFLGVKPLATNLGLYLSSAIESEFLLEDPFTTYRFASWRKVSENSSSILYYGLSLTVNDFSLEKNSEESIAFLKELESPSTR